MSYVFSGLSRLVVFMASLELIFTGCITDLMIVAVQ